MKSKRGVSPIIATVLLLLLTIAGVSIIAGVLIPFIKDSLTKSTACLAYQNYFKFSDTFSYNCYQKSGSNNLHAVTIKTEASSELADNVIGFELVFLKTGSSKKASVIGGSDKTSEMRMLESTEAKFIVPLPGETMTYVFTNANVFEGVEIYPVMSNKKICDKTDSINLAECRGGITIPA